MGKPWFIRSISIVLVLGLALALAAFAISSGSAKAQEDTIGVVVTILPQKDFVKAVGGDKVDVTFMVPPGSTPHAVEPTPEQLEKLEGADVYFKIGSGVGFEIKNMDTIEGYFPPPKKCIVDCSQSIELMGNDPHIWLSPKNAKIMVKNICAGLIQVDSDNENYYTQNKEKYLQRLDELDRNIEDMRSGMENKHFMVYHPAWGYFARDYDLQQIEIERAGKEPTAQQIIESVEEAKSHGIKVIFASPEFSTESAETIARDIGGRVVLLSPLPENYIAEMYILVGQLARPGETEAAGAQSQWWYWALAAGIGGIAIGAIGMYALAGRRRSW